MQPSVSSSVIALEKRQLPVYMPSPSRVAVLLNRNARKVTDRLAKQIERVVGADNLFYSRNVEEAEAFSREIVQRGYGTIVCGGGDGTLVRSANLVQQYVEEANAWRVARYERFGEKQSLLAMPRFAFLRLGTGNAMARLIGATDPVEDLQRIVDFVPSRTQTVSLIEMNGDRFFFAGLGYDAVILNDYDWLRSHTKYAVLKWVMHTILGYFAAAIGRSIPRVLAGEARSIEARIVNLGEAYYVDPRRGDYLSAIEPETTLFEGEATFIGMATMPFYGYGMKMYPFAGMRPGMLQLRVANVGPLTALGHLPGIWRGSYRSKEKLFDFLVNHVRIETSRPYPFQHSGDAQGERQHLELKIAHQSLTLVDLHHPRRFA